MCHTNLPTKASAYAEQAHEGQFRKYTGAPYFHHVVSVAERVAELVDDEEMIAAAFTSISKNPKRLDTDFHPSH